MRRKTPSPRRRASFVLLEVTLAMMILSVVMLVSLRGFITSIGAIRELRLSMTATLLAESLLDDFELEPPSRGRGEGSFGDDERFGEPFENFTYTYTVDVIQNRYDGIPRRLFQDPEPLYEMTLEIWYDDGRFRRFRPFQTKTYLLDTQLFSDEAIVENQLF